MATITPEIMDPKNHPRYSRPLKGAREFRETPEIPFSPVSGISGKDERSFHLWRITPPGRPSFMAWCIQGATKAEMLTVWTGAKVEAIW